MTEIIFQFIPRQIGEVPNSNMSSNFDISTIDIDRKHRIEYNKFGSIRFVFEFNPSTDLNIYNIFNRAKNSIEKELDIKLENYSACLLITGDDPVLTYLNKEDHILEFSQSQFECMDPTYSEINDQTIKVSFRKGLKC